MIDRLIEFSARHRFVVVTLAVAAAVVGWRSMTRLPLDALPDTGDRQVIVHSTWDRSPDLIDAQVTSPIVSALLGAPRVRSVRGISDYGSSFVYVIFDDDTDLYWARSRTLEVLSSLRPRLPEDATTGLGPDASSLGWVFQYALVDPTGAHDLQSLRSYQDWTLKPYLRSVPGVAEVASVGGFVRQFQVNVDPNRLRAYGLSIQRVVEALKRGNGDVGGRIVESGGRELIVRGLGSAHGTEDLENVLVATAEDATPVRIADVAHVTVGSEFRRGATDLDGMGEAVSGIVIMREGENALDVIARVKDRLHRIEPSLPAGVKVVPVYDRSELVRRSVDTLTRTILEVMAIVAVVILVFLWHPPSAAVPLITLPIAVLIAFVPFEFLGIGANVMSLGGLAIAVGALVDAAIVVVEQSHKRLEEWDLAGRVEPPGGVILGAIKQVGRPSFFALLVIAISFLPVLTLQGEAGRLFKPLAFAKSLAMIVAAVLAVTLDPALRVMLTRVKGFRIHQERAHPVNRWVMRWYEPTVAWSLRNKRLLFGVVTVLMLSAVPLWLRLGTEFMPPFDEGTLLYMPSTMPGISISEAERLLEVTDRILAGFPEVERVLGKAGRADTATDPAPVSMLETVIVLKPKESWRPRISREELVRQMDAALTLPGVANAWSMPVRGRLDMLTTGIRTPVGIKIAGSSVTEIERLGAQIVSLLRGVKGTRGVFSEQIGRATFLDVRWDRQALARAGIMLDEAQAAVQYAIGGDNVTTIVTGRERYAVNVRYPLDLRGDPQALGRVLVTAAGGRAHVPIAELASIQTTSGPAMLRNEDGMLTGYVYVDTSARDVVSYVRDADRLIRDTVRLPQGYSISWTGQYEAIGKTRRQLTAIVPLTLLPSLFFCTPIHGRFPRRSSCSWPCRSRRSARSGRSRCSVTTSAWRCGWGSSRSWASMPRPVCSCCSTSTMRTTGPNGTIASTVRSISSRRFSKGPRDACGPSS
jgi:Cu(I)/Ag(I) efflux system membrane protein CusA/SilA